MRKTYIGMLDLSKMRIMHHDLNTPINPILQYSNTPAPFYRQSRLSMTWPHESYLHYRNTHHPLTAPAVKPLTIAFWAMEKNISPGSAVNMAVAVIESH
jgi:hypothetical protein